MTGTLRATFNKLYDPLQGFSICTTAQCFLLQLAHDLQQVPTLDICSLNTDAILYTIEEEYKNVAHDILHNWEKLTGLELEEDKVVKLVMANVNNYCEIVQVGDNDYKVNYKGGYFNGIHKFKWNKEKKTFEYSFQDGLETNSLTIVSEALLKYFLFDIPIENTIKKCNDIHRFQMISHLGSTYEKCVQESAKGDILLQRNCRIYASNEKTGAIIKVKYDGRRDKLANQPPNPIIDNGNKCTIDQINKQWYIKLATQWANDFLGIKRLTEYKKDELLTMAKDIGLEVDKKIKKDELIKMIEKRNEVMKMATKKVETNEEVKTMTIYEKIAKMTKEIREHDFVMDCVNPGNLGGKEYASIGQYYNLLHNLCDKYRLLFKWEVMDLEEFEKEVFKPTGKMPSNVAIVGCKATFMDLDAIEQNKITSEESFGYLDTIYAVSYKSMAGGSDIADKSVSGASTLAFRNWFDKNFTPKYMNTIEEEITESSEEKTEAPKIPTYIPPQKKEEIKEEVVSTKQNSDDEDIKRVIDKIMKIRDIGPKKDYGSSTLDAIMRGETNASDLLAIELKLDNKLDELGGNE